MSLVLWRSAPFRRGLKADWSERLSFPSEPQHAILLPTCTERILSTGRRSLSDKYARCKQELNLWTRTKQNVSRGAIHMMQMDWIKVDGVVHNSTTNQYEVQCTYQREDQGQTLSRESWTMLKIKSPRKSDRDTDTTRWRPGTSLSILSWTLSQKSHRSRPSSKRTEEMLFRLAFFKTAHAACLSLSATTTPISTLTHY